jgi:hypothetical protein
VPRDGRSERDQRLISWPLIDSGCDNPLRHFAAMVAACSMVISGDTLAMDLSLALDWRNGRVVWANWRC